MVYSIWDDDNLKTKNFANNLEKWHDESVSNSQMMSSFGEEKKEGKTIRSKKVRIIIIFLLLILQTTTDIVI